MLSFKVVIHCFTIATRVKVVRFGHVSQVISESKTDANSIMLNNGGTFVMRKIQIGYKRIGYCLFWISARIFRITIIVTLRTQQLTLSRLKTRFCYINTSSFFDKCIVVV